MTKSFSIAVAASLFVLSAVSGTAMADIPPLDACTNVGAACQMHDGRPGTCAVSTCSRPDYASRSGDGPMEFVDYPCNLCEPSGTGEPALADDETAEAEATSAPAAESGESSSFCSVQPGSRGRFGLALMLIATAAWVRRRANRRSGGSCG